MVSTPKAAIPCSPSRWGVNADTLAQIQGMFKRAKEFVDKVYLPDMLFAAKLKEMYPPNVVLWGVQPSAWRSAWSSRML